MAKEVIGYKVVREVRHTTGATCLLSAAERDPAWVVAYTPGFASYPRQGTALFAFDSLAHARKFASYGFSARRVWKARLLRPKLRRRLCRWVHSYLDFWTGGWRRNTFQAPVGTLACDAVTLLEQV